MLKQKKKRVREMQAEINSFNAQQREHEEMMIRHVEDDGDGDDDDDDEDNDDDDEDVNTKKHMLPPKIAKRKDSKQHCKTINYKLWKAEEICNIRDIFHAKNNSWCSKVSLELLAKKGSS
jgi:vacuolar-type H+-ATPase subunit I/STV1